MAFFFCKHFCLLDQSHLVDFLSNSFEIRNEIQYLDENWCFWFFQTVDLLETCFFSFASWYSLSMHSSRFMRHIRMKFAFIFFCSMIFSWLNFSIITSFASSLISLIWSDLILNLLREMILSCISSRRFACHVFSFVSW